MAEAHFHSFSTAVRDDINAIRVQAVQVSTQSYVCQKVFSIIHI